jgi:hypothetical protein
MDRADAVKKQNPIDAAEKYVAEAASTAFSSVDKPMDPSKVNHDPKFFKPQPLSKLKKDL